MRIISGTGSSKAAGVDNRNRLIVNAETFSYQHTISKQDGEAYQVRGLANTSSSAAVTVLHLKNTSGTKFTVPTYIRMQVSGRPAGQAGASAFDSSSYFSVIVSDVYTSGGTEVVPTSVSVGSGKTADVTCFDSAMSAIVTDDSGTEIDRWYTKEYNEMLVYNKEGAIVIHHNQTLSIKYVSDMDDDYVHVRISFVMEDVDAGE